MPFHDDFPAANRPERALYILATAPLAIVILAFAIQPWVHFAGLCIFAGLVSAAVAGVAFFRGNVGLAGWALLATIIIFLLAAVVPNLEKA